MKGAIFLQSVNGCLIAGNTFEGNDGLPIYNIIQEIGLIHYFERVYGDV